MKFLLKTLSITIFLGISPIFARSTGTPTPPPASQQIPPVPQKITPPIIPQKPQPSVIPTPIQQQKQQPIQQPLIQEKSYKDLVTYIKNSRNVWNASTSMLSAEFVRTIVQKARTLKLSAFQAEALLQTARDIHAQFSGNKNKDIAILQAIDQQIAAAIK